MADNDENNNNEDIENNDIGNKEEYNDKVIQATIEEEMQRSYIDYSMSVIVSRALPDVRDGLKPVQRRILFGMSDLGLFYNKKENKCARIVGEVMGKYHPHGDSSIYSALVRMAQPFSYRYPLVLGQGNFGNLDMGPASMRYTEAKLRKLSSEMLSDINKDTVDFTTNYDDTLSEPSVMPTRVPNLLINGAQGIAVGLATSIPPHNLSEVLKGVLALLDNPDIPIEPVKAIPEEGIEESDGLMNYITAPDFPSKGTIYGYAGIKDIYNTGRGRFLLRGKVETILSEKKGVRDKIVITELPYQVSRTNIIEKIIELVKDKRIDGIYDANNESSKETRIVLELKKDANPEVIINQLYKLTQLQTSVSGNVIALVNGKPMQLNLKQILVQFVKHREEVIVRRTQFDLKKATDRIHILEGLKIAQDNIDRVIAIIRGSKNSDIAKQSLIAEFSLSEIQATAILAMRLGQLTGLEIEKLLNEIAELRELIIDLQDILDRKERRIEIMKFETEEILEKYGDERATDIIHNAGEFTDEDMIPNDDMVITISNEGYIKRTNSLEFRSQGRGGKGSKGAASKDTDFTKFIFSALNHSYILFFTDNGKVFWKKVWQLPEMSRTAKGRPLVNLIERTHGEKVTQVVVVNDFEKDGKFLLMATKKGILKKTDLKAYSRPNRGGIKAINLREDDELLQVMVTSGENEVILGTKFGYANRFNESEIREVGRFSIGVKGINLRDGDETVGMVVAESDQDPLLVVSENGYGKRTLLENYRKTKRGSKGVKSLNVTEKVGQMISISKAVEEDDLMIVTAYGIVIKQNVDNIRVMSRNTQGVRLISLKGEDKISDICIVPKIEEEEEAVIVEGETNSEVSPEAKVDTELTDSKLDESNESVEKDVTE